MIVRHQSSLCAMCFVDYQEFEFAMRYMLCGLSKIRVYCALCGKSNIRARRAFVLGGESIDRARCALSVL